MFSALRQGSILHVLDKGDNKLNYRTVSVESISQPRPKYTTSPYGGTPKMVIDIITRDKDGTQDFRDIPADVSYGEFNNGAIIISETREPLINIVTTRLSNNEQIVNNFDFYKEDIISCKNVLKKINPDFAKREEQEERIDKLSKEINDIKEGFGGMQSDIKQLLTLVGKSGNS